MARFEDAIDTILAHEGGLVDNHADPGGITNFGISIAWLETVGDIDHDGWLAGDFDHDGDVDADDIRKMTRDEAVALYRSQWWNRYGYGRINDQSVATKVFDIAVNMGPGWGARLLQRALNSLGFPVNVDGGIGTQTLIATNAAPADRLLAQIRIEHARRYEQLIAANPKLAVFRNGWLRRAAE